MARNTSVSLGEHFAEFVDRQVVGVRYGRNFVAAGLLEKQETRLDALRAALVGGENSGTAQLFDVEDLLAAKRRDRAARAALTSPRSPRSILPASGKVMPVRLAQMVTVR